MPDRGTRTHHYGPLARHGLRARALCGILRDPFQSQGPPTVPNTESSRKRVRQNAKRNALNNWRKRLVKDQIKSLEKTLHDKDLKGAEASFRNVCRVLDKVSSTTTMHKNAASRKKSRLHKRLKALQTAGK